MFWWHKKNLSPRHHPVKPERPSNAVALLCLTCLKGCFSFWSGKISFTSNICGGHTHFILIKWMEPCDVCWHFRARHQCGAIHHPVTRPRVLYYVMAQWHFRVISWRSPTQKNPCTALWTQKEVLGRTKWFCMKGRSCNHRVKKWWYCCSEIQLQQDRASNTAGQATIIQESSLVWFKEIDKALGFMLIWFRLLEEQGG